eukprot:gene3317-6568_t
MSSAEDELWNIFTYYSLHGNPMDPSRIDAAHYYKLCKDSFMILKGKNRPTDELKLLCTMEVKKRGQISSINSEGKGLSFEEFISSLIRISQRCYPNKDNNSDDSFLNLLLDNILPYAKRRFPISLQSLINEPSIDSLFISYESSFFNIFKFYCNTSEDINKDKTMLQSTITPLPPSKTLDEMNLSITTSTYNKKRTSTKNTVRMSYADFLRFSNDYGLIS